MAVAMSFLLTLQAFNWPKAADYGGKVTTLSCFFTGAFSIFFRISSGVGLYTLFIGFVIASIELPLVRA